MRRWRTTEQQKLFEMCPVIYHLFDDQLALSLDSHWVDPLTAHRLILRSLRSPWLCASGPLLFSEQTLRTTETHREEISRCTLIVAPACPRCRQSVAGDLDRLNPRPALSPLMPGTACRDTHSPRVASAGTTTPASLRRVPGTATFAHRAQSA